MGTATSRGRRLRGALAGACSAVVTAGAHAAAGGMMPGGGPLVAASLLCATVGAALALPALQDRRARLLGVIGALALAQLLGHLLLTMASGHHHGGAAVPSAMVAAHIAGAVLLGVAITSVEYLYLACTSVLCWLRLFATSATRPAVHSIVFPANDVVAQSVLRCSGLGMRAPPRLAPSIA